MIRTHYNGAGSFIKLVCTGAAEGSRIYYFIPEKMHGQLEGVVLQALCVSPSCRECSEIAHYPAVVPITRMTIHLESKFGG